jgi:hypothetical protein
MAGLDIDVEIADGEGDHRFARPIMVSTTKVFSLIAAGVASASTAVTLLVASVTLK